MEIKNRSIYERANRLLKSMYGTNARFREGQYEAIEATMTQHRTLVVQKTGWGKSLVYFVCTKLLRSEHKGCTLVVSPLLALMQNQLEAAAKMGLRCNELNSLTRDCRGEILYDMMQDRLDLVLVTPESLYKDDLQLALKNIRIGLFVIDEAHCISDWGHDFRLEYGMLRNVLSQLPPNVPVLATTATANDRVVCDLEAQLGSNVYVSRGPLTRESLWIQVLHMQSKEERYAWILEHINELPGSGIIYCLTQRDCEYLTDFLQAHNISAMSYYSKSREEDITNRIAEEKFRHNELKALVATVKLGMGYDKGDIAFIIHFQMPQNIVSYYQQIGRAGRNIDRAYIFLMSGAEDIDILDYFIRTAFPTEEEMSEIYTLIREQAGAGIRFIAGNLNIRRARIDKALSFMQKDGYIFKDHSRYYVSPKPYRYDREHYDAITRIRQNEVIQMQKLINTRECYSKFIVGCLDDKSAPVCGHCANCLGRDIISAEVGDRARLLASEYINGRTITILPRKMWISAQRSGKIKYINMPGICIAKYGDAGYGEMVKEDKYSGQGRFRDELVERSVRLLTSLVRDERILHITCVPSLRSNMVEDFSIRLAKRLGIRYVRLLGKTGSRQQKEMANSSHQCDNALNSFYAASGVRFPRKMLLVDDVVDSKWTLTVCGYLLMEQGCDEVYPFALADSSQKED